HRRLGLLECFDLTCCGISTGEYEGRRQMDSPHPWYAVRTGELTMTRRDYLQFMSAAAMTAAAASAAGDASDRERRMKWWHEARFGMFIHWGLYSVVGR